MMSDSMAAMAAFPMHLNHLNPSAGVVSSMPVELLTSRKEERIPQWGYQETKDFIVIRTDLEKDFLRTKRNKVLWEVVATRMREQHGYFRSAEQCKCKWKNLANRYKQEETAEADNGRQCHFHEDLRAFFVERAKNKEKLLLEPDCGGRSKKRGVATTRKGERSSEEFSEDDDEDEEESEEERPAVKKRKQRKATTERDGQRATVERSRANNMQEVLEDFFQQQQRMEMEWRESTERRERERRVEEQEWRIKMEALEKQRILMEQAWRDKEEQRREREEIRADRRDSLFNALLSRLNSDG